MITRRTSPASDLLVAVLLLFASVTAQTSSGTGSSCDSIYDCNACLSHPNGCAFAVGTCFDSCQEPDNGATCYSTDAFTVSVSEVCELYDTDNLKCTSMKSCQDCIETLKSDGKPCQWYENAGACFGGGTGPFGSGALTCPRTDVTPTAAPIVEEDCVSSRDCQSCLQDDCAWSPSLERCAPTCENFPQDAECHAASTFAGQNALAACQAVTDTCEASNGDCQTCLESNCAWSPNAQACAPSCSDLPQDTECYSSSTFADLNAQDTCQAATNVAQDRELCFGKSRCEICTNTQKSDGTNCQWYTDQTTGVEWCQVGGCDQSGFCGSETCEATAAEDDSDKNNNITVATDNNNGGGASGCDSFDGYGPDGCLPCLSSDQNCAWVLQTCVPSCSSMADAPCFSTTTHPDSTPDEICKEANVGQEDVALCGSKNYCFTCTSTIKSDGVSTCSWYTNGDQEWCDVGGCNADGICGDSDEAICQPPEVEEPDSGSSSSSSNNNGGSMPVMPSINDGNNSSATTMRRGWGWMVATTMIMAVVSSWGL